LQGKSRSRLTNPAGREFSERQRTFGEPSKNNCPKMQKDSRGGNTFNCLQGRGGRKNRKQRLEPRKKSKNGLSATPREKRKETTGRKIEAGKWTRRARQEKETTSKSV